MALAANEKKTIGVIGAGSWGTALAITLSNKGHEVRITDLDQAMLADMAEKHENTKYLPGAKFGDHLTPVRREGDVGKNRFLPIGKAHTVEFDLVFHPAGLGQTPRPLHRKRRFGEDRVQTVETVLHDRQPGIQLK